jgi:hypothetical protein
MDKYKRYLGKRVSVLWVDIITSGGWLTEPNGNQKVYPCDSCGYVSGVFDNKALGPYLVLSATRGGDEYTQHISIPVGVIRKVSLL